MKASSRLVTACAIVVVTAAAAAGQDSLAAARDLYAGAAYEDALLLLNRLRAAGPRSDETPAIDQYRAFCLLALGRAADAEQAIEAVVAAQPSYQPSGSQVSPRVRSAFSDVRRRVLPTIVQQRYASAKAAFDRKDFVQAESGFKQVLDVLGDPDVASRASQPPLSDLKTLAAGFYDLSAAAAAPPPPPPPPAPPPPPSEPPPPETVVTSPLRIYGPTDPGVVAPVTVRQWLPAFRAQTMVTSSPGSIEVVVDETGAVEAATMKTPMDPAYDRLALAAARTWQYRPATLNGVPVKFRKTVQISVQR